MGAFFVLRNAAPSQPDRSLLGRLREHFLASGFTTPFEATTANWHVAVYPRLNATQAHVYRVDEQNFAFATGTLLYRGTTGSAALAQIWMDEERGVLDRARLRGIYALGICRRGVLTLNIDAHGSYKVYHDAAWMTVSSAFLAPLMGVRDPVADLQGIYEYVFQGATYGGRTLVKGISLLDHRQAARLDRAGTLIPAALPAHPGNEARSFDAHVEQSVAALREWFGEIVTCFGDRIDTALSGGYDSRLILALLRDRGCNARLHVYGGKDDDDVRVARDIAEGEGLLLEHADKSAQHTAAGSLHDIIARNCRLLDAYPVDGIMDGGADVATRRDRAAGGALALNGGGGEIFRNFFYLPDRPFSIREVIWTFYSQFDPASATRLFSERAYIEAMVAAVASSLGVSSDTLRREEVERVYPAFRCRYWMGRNTSVNNQFGAALTPFIEQGIVDAAVEVPIRFKHHGRFEAALIRALSPSLARYPSSYGHSFAESPSLRRRIKDQFTLLRPPLLRRYAFRLKSRLLLPPPDLTRYGRVVDPAFPIMAQYFRMPRVRDAGQFARICTLEFLFTRYGIGSAGKL